MVRLLGAGTSSNSMQMICWQINICIETTAQTSVTLKRIVFCSLNIQARLCNSTRDSADGNAATAQHASTEQQQRQQQRRRWQRRLSRHCKAERDLRDHLW